MYSFVLFAPLFVIVLIENATKKVKTLSRKMAGVNPFFGLPPWNEICVDEVKYGCKVKCWTGM